MWQLMVNYSKLVWQLLINLSKTGGVATTSASTEVQIMEDMFWKFPHIGEQIFKKLSNKSLLKCMKVAKTWKYFITNEKFCKLRVKYETMQKTKDENGCTPLHEAAKNGEFLECKMIIANVENKNPQDKVNSGYDRSKSK